MKNITSKKIKLHKDLIELKNSFAIHMKTRRIKPIIYFFSSCVHCVNIKFHLRTFKTNITTYSTFLQRLIKELSTHVERRRNDEHEHIFEHREEFKNIDHLINEINSLTQFSFD
jgi:hypothetical protein